MLQHLEGEVNAYVPFSLSTPEEQLYVLAAQLKTVQVFVQLPVIAAFDPSDLAD